MTVADIQLRSIHSVVDDNGTLVVAEVGRQVPFEIARIFSISGVGRGEDRGHHAHKKLSQMMICLSGTVEVTVDDGKGRSALTLDHPAKALLVPPGIWAEQTYGGPEAVLLVLCDRVYEEDDYIRDYQGFITYRSLAGQAK